MNNKKRRIIGYIMAILFLCYCICDEINYVFNIKPEWTGFRNQGVCGIIVYIVIIIVIISAFVKAAKNGFRDEEEQQKADKKNKSRSASKNARMPNERRTNDSFAP